MSELQLEILQSESSGVTGDLLTTSNPSDAEHSSHRPGVADIAAVFLAPVRLFNRVEDTGTYGWTLTLLLLGLALVGWLEIRTGLVDRVVDLQTEQNLAELEKQQLDLVDRLQFKDRMEEIRKEGEFTKLLHRLMSVAFAPLGMLVSCLVISSILYAVVALTGRKPEYHTLMTICVYSGFVVLAGSVLRLAMMIFYRTTRVDTSLALLSQAGAPSYLVVLDPFRIWFWILIFLGLSATHQLGRKTAVVACSLMFLISSGVRLALSFAQSG